MEQNDNDFGPPNNTVKQLPSGEIKLNEEIRSDSTTPNLANLPKRGRPKKNPLAEDLSIIEQSKELEEKLLEKHEEPPIAPNDFLSSGSTLLNLAGSDNVNGYFVKGKYSIVVGDSASGKTFLSLTCLAEASKNENFKDYRFIYDNAEDGALMPIAQFFGQAVADRIEAPAEDENGIPLYSTTIEEFYYNVDNAKKKGKPFIYILDSMDSLTSESEGNKFQEQKKAHEKGKEAAGSYTDGKAKANSQNLRQLIAFLRRERQSIIIIISQTRDSMGYGKSRSGGNALRFYALNEVWGSIADKILKTIEGKKRQIGIICQLKIKKNRITGKERTITIPIFHSYGIDDIGSCIQYLIDENHWQLEGQKVIAPEFNLEVKPETLIKYIEKEGFENELKAIVQKVWTDIENKCKADRKPRY